MNDATGKPLESRSRRQLSPEKNNKTKSLIDLCSMQSTSTKIKDHPERSAPLPERRQKKAAKLPLDLCSSDADWTTIAEMSTVAEDQYCGDTARKSLAGRGRSQPSPEKMQNTTMNGSKDRREGFAPSERQEMKAPKAPKSPSSLCDSYTNLSEESKKSVTIEFPDLLSPSFCRTTVPPQQIVTDVSNMKIENHAPIPFPDLLCTNNGSRHLEPMPSSQHIPPLVEQAGCSDAGAPFPEMRRKTPDSPEQTSPRLENTLNLSAFIVEATSTLFGTTKQNFDKQSNAQVTEVCPSGNSHHPTDRSQRGSIQEDDGRMVSSRDGNASDVKQETKTLQEPSSSRPTDHSQTKPVSELTSAMPGVKRRVGMHGDKLSSPAATDRSPEKSGIEATSVDVLRRDLIKAKDEIESRIVHSRCSADSTSRLSDSITPDDQNGRLTRGIVTEKYTDRENEEIEIVFSEDSLRIHEVFSEGGTQGMLFDCLGDKGRPSETSIPWWERENWGDLTIGRDLVSGSSTEDDMVEIITCTDDSSNDFKQRLNRSSSKETSSGNERHCQGNSEGETSVVRASSPSTGAFRAVPLASSLIIESIETTNSDTNQECGVDTREVHKNCVAVRPCEDSSLVQRPSFPDAVEIRPEGTRHSVAAMSIASTIQEVDSRSTDQPCDDFSLGYRPIFPDAVEIISEVEKRVGGARRSVADRSIASTIQEVDSQSTAQSYEDSSLGYRPVFPDAVETRPEVESRAGVTERSVAARSIASTIQEVDSRSTAQPCDDFLLGHRPSFPDAVVTRPEVASRAGVTQGSVAAVSIASTIQEVDSRSTIQPCDDFSLGCRPSFPDAVETRPEVESRVGVTERSIAARSIASTIQEVDSLSTAQPCDDFSLGCRPSFPDAVVTRPEVESRAGVTQGSVAAVSIASTIQEVDSLSTAQPCDDFSLGCRPSFPDAVETRPEVEKRVGGARRSIAARSIASTIQEVDSLSTAQPCDDFSLGCRPSFPDAVKIISEVERRAGGARRSVAAISIASTIQEVNSCSPGKKPYGDESNYGQPCGRRQTKSLSQLRESVNSAQAVLGQRLSALIPKRALKTMQPEHDILANTQREHLEHDPKIKFYQGSMLLESKDSAKVADVERINTSIHHGGETECDASKTPNLAPAGHRVKLDHAESINSIIRNERKEEIQKQGEPSATGAWRMTMNYRASGGLEPGVKDASIECGQPPSLKEPSEVLQARHKSDSAPLQYRAASIGDSTSIGKSANADDLVEDLRHDQKGSDHSSVEQGPSTSAEASQLSGHVTNLTPGKHKVQHSGESEGSVESRQALQPEDYFKRSAKHQVKHGHTDSIHSTIINGREAGIQKQDEPSVTGAWRMTMNYRGPGGQEASSECGQPPSLKEKPPSFKEPSKVLQTRHKSDSKPVISAGDSKDIEKCASPDVSHRDVYHPRTFYSPTCNRVTFSQDVQSEDSSELWQSICDDESPPEHPGPYSDPSHTFYSVEVSREGGTGDSSYEKPAKKALEVIFETDLGKASTEETGPEVAVLHHGTEEVVELLHLPVEDLPIGGTMDPEEVEIVFVEDSFLTRGGFAFGETKGIIFDWLESETTRESQQRDSCKRERQSSSRKPEIREPEIISLVGVDQNEEVYRDPCEDDSLQSFQNEESGYLPGVDLSEKAVSPYRKVKHQWLRDIELYARCSQNSHPTGERGTSFHDVTDLTLLPNNQSEPHPTSERGASFHDVTDLTLLPNNQSEPHPTGERGTSVHDSTDLTMLPNNQREPHPTGERESPAHDATDLILLPNNQSKPFFEDDIEVATALSLCRNDECEILFTMDPHQDKVLQEQRLWPAAEKANRCGLGMEVPLGSLTRIDTHACSRARQISETLPIFSGDPSRGSDPPGSSPQERVPHSNEAAFKWKDPDAPLGIDPNLAKDEASTDNSLNHQSSVRHDDISSMLRQGQSRHAKLMARDNRETMNESVRDGGAESTLYRRPSAHPIPRRELTWNQAEQLSTRPKYGDPRDAELMARGGRDEMNCSPRDGGIERPLFDHQSQSSQPFLGCDLTRGQAEQISAGARYVASRIAEPMPPDGRDEMNDSGRDSDVEGALYHHRSQSDEPFLGRELTWKEVERLYRPPGQSLWRPDQAWCDHACTRKPQASASSQFEIPSRLDFEKRVGACLNLAREGKEKWNLPANKKWERIQATAAYRVRNAATQQHNPRNTNDYQVKYGVVLDQDDSSLLTSSISENIESRLSKRARNNIHFLGNRRGNHRDQHADYWSVIEDESTDSTLTSRISEFVESRGTQSTRDDVEPGRNEIESSLDGHYITSTESTEIVFFDGKETDEPETSLFGSTRSDSSHDANERHFPFSLSLDLRSKTRPLALPPQPPLDLRSKHLPEGPTILKNQKERMEKPPIDRSSSSLRREVQLRDMGQGERYQPNTRQMSTPLLLRARKHLLSRHGRSTGKTGQARVNPIDEDSAAHTKTWAEREKCGELSRVPKRLANRNYDEPASGEESRENAVTGTVCSESE
jgi:hypothetical protein